MWARLEADSLQLGGQACRELEDVRLQRWPSVAGPRDPGGGLARLQDDSLPSGSCAHRETAHLVVLSGREVVFIDGIESPHALRVASRVGRLLPGHATSVGKAMLAALPPEQVRALYDHAGLAAVTARTITSLAALERQLEAIRERGYAVNHAESENGVGSVGMAVRNPAGEPRAALSVALPLDRWSEAAEQWAATELRAATAALGAYL